MRAKPTNNILKNSATKPTYIFNNISLNSSYNEKYLKKKRWRENQNTFYVLQTFSPKIAPFMRQCEKKIYCRAGKATDENTAHALYMLDT
jgi:hypothetical protein